MDGPSFDDDDEPCRMYPFSRRCHGGPTKAPVVARIVTVGPSSFSTFRGEMIVVCWCFKKRTWGVDCCDLKMPAFPAFQKPEMFSVLLLQKVVRRWER